MTPFDEAPEQRWRRTVDRRSRPAKLKVDRLLRDFGYAELDPQVGDAIEARLAGVALTVSPSLRDASPGDVVTMYANDVAPSAVARSAIEAIASKPEPEPEQESAAEPPEPAVAADVAQMVSYLKQQVLDARADTERLRTELDRRIAARTDAEADAQAIIAEQAATLQEQSRQLVELGAALNDTRQALAETRDEIRRAVGELQALPEPEPLPHQHAADEEPEDETLFGDEEPADLGEEPAAAPANVTAGPAQPVAEDDLVSAGEPATSAAQPAFYVEEPGAGVGDAAVDVEAPALDLDAPAIGAETNGAELDDPGSTVDAPARDAPAGQSWVPAQLREADAGAHAHEGEPVLEELLGAGEPGIGDDELLAGFDDFLYDEDELYDPATAAAGGESFDGPLGDAPAPEQPATALPPPPPAPPSPWAEEPEPGAPPGHDRPTLGRVLRGRGGRSRGRWHGSCSICGRQPEENRRKDLAAAGWDLDDEAAACPQCRGLG